MKRIVTVTQEHIDNGRVFSPRSCPIALALKDAGFSNPSVGVYEADVERTGLLSLILKCRVIKLPYEASEFITAFDSAYLLVKPFTFEVR